MVTNPDAHTAINAVSDMFRQKESPTRSRRKVVQKDQFILKESVQLGCVSQDSYPSESVLREPGKLESKHAVKFSKGGIIQKCAPHERSAVHPITRQALRKRRILMRGSAVKSQD